MCVVRSKEYWFAFLCVMVGEVNWVRVNMCCRETDGPTRAEGLTVISSSVEVPTNWLWLVPLSSLLKGRE